jgi:aminopeptidase N
LDVAVSDPTGAAIEYRYDGNIITVVWEAPFSKVGETRQIVVKYTVQDPVSGMHFSVPDEKFPLQSLHVITDNETERARYWLATVDAPICRPTIKWTVTVADPIMTVLANGNQISETAENGIKVVVHQLDYGCPSYLLSLAVGDFIRGAPFCTSLFHDISQLVNLFFLFGR